MMTKTLAIILLTSSSAIGIAQNVNIPDANFKAYLVGNTSINTTPDTEIDVSEAQAYSGSINCANLSISNMTGIEAFTAITNLNCTDNQITSIDLSQNLALTYLSVYNNNLTSLDVSQISSLNRLWCMFNPITSLDLSQNSNLVFLQANNCSLTSLNLANGNNTNFIGASSNNNNLTCIQVDDAAYSIANWTSGDFSKDAGASFSDNCAGTSSIETSSQFSLNIFPNPAYSTLNIESSKNDIIKILNSLGKTVQVQKVEKGMNTLSIDILENGIYIIVTENGITQKFIKQ
jgi:hypothetical protein